MTGMYDDEDEHEDDWFYDNYYDTHERWLAENEWLCELGYTFDPETGVATNYTIEDINGAQPC